MSEQNYTPVHGDQISGSPALLSRYITVILAQGAHFQFVDGETIEVLVPGAGESIVTSLGDTVVAPKPEPEPDVIPKPEPEAEVEVVVAIAEEATDTIVAEAADAIHEIVEEAVEHAAEIAVEVAEEIEAPAPAPAKRGRKPAAKPVEGE